MLEAFEASARPADRLARPADRAGTEPGDEAPTSERIGDEDPGFELVEDRVAIDAGSDVLDEHEREVLRLRFVEDLTQSKIAERVGHSQMHVSRILRRALGEAARGRGRRRARRRSLSADAPIADREELAVAVGARPGPRRRALSSEASKLGSRIPSSSRRAAARLQRADADLERALLLGDRDARGAVREAAQGRWRRSRR